MAENRPLLAPIYVPEKIEKLSPSNYPVYKLHTNPKDKKSVVYLLIVGIYMAGTLSEWLQFIETIFLIMKRKDIKDSKAVHLLVKSLPWWDTL
eukprot:15331174-Ditylum_brightwellii.AAC.1